MIALNEPLSDQEIAELDEFLMSDATPGERMIIVELDGFFDLVGDLDRRWFRRACGSGPSGAARRSRSSNRRHNRSV